MTIDLLSNLIDRLRARPGCTIVDGGIGFSGAAIGVRVDEYAAILSAQGCARTVVGLLADYSVDAIAMLLAAWKTGNTVALMTSKGPGEAGRLCALCEATHLITLPGLAEGTSFDIRTTGHTTGNKLLLDLVKDGEPGFIIFSSGTTGTPKSSLHRLRPLLDRYAGALPQKAFKTISFLLFDHIGGLNTLLKVLFGGGELVCITSRTPDVVCAAVQDHGVQALITSPTFLNLLLLSGAAHRHDLSSLQVVNYGTEPMSEATLVALNAMLPAARLSQAYGATEIGVIPTRSESSVSKWMKIGDAQCDVRIVGGLLEVKTNTTMIGYLNEESPFTPDGYYRTGDTAVQRGDLMQVLGRQSELINVGGEKFFPIEVESVLQQMAGVADVCVSKAHSPLVGQVVTATFRLHQEEAREPFRRRLFEFCRGRLSPARVPVNIVITGEPLHGDRFKKIRLQTNGV